MLFLLLKKKNGYISNYYFSKFNLKTQFNFLSLYDIYSNFTSSLLSYRLHLTSSSLEKYQLIDTPKNPNGTKFLLEVGQRKCVGVANIDFF